MIGSEGQIVLPSDANASGRSFGDDELELLREVIESGVLNATRGEKVRCLSDEFAQQIGSGHAIACSSGTAAVHAAVAAVDPEPGDEIVTTPITDMGALTPILYQGAIPVFADVDPLTGNISAETIRAQLSERTKAIIVTHLFGNPCGMDDILALAESRSIPVIEDAAQALLATVNGRHTGAMGTIGCFSLQQGKHITSGEGGLVVTDDERLARRLRLFVDKAWGYGDPQPDHYFLALNYRMTELQGAVALAQLRKLKTAVDKRVEMAERLSAALASVPGLRVPQVAPSVTHVYWRYLVNVDPEIVPGGPTAIATALRGYDIASAPRYIQKPAFRCEVFAKQRTFGNSRFPFTLARPEAVDYAEERFPGSTAWLDAALVLPLNERYETQHVDYVAEALRDAVATARAAGK